MQKYVDGRLVDLTPEEADELRARGEALAPEPVPALVWDYQFAG